MIIDQDSTVFSLRKFLKLRQNIQGKQLLVHFNAKPITQYQFSAMLSKCLRFLHIHSLALKSNLFRMGGATQLYIKGQSETQIKTNGR